MTRRKVNFWDDDIEYRIFSAEEQPNYLNYLNTNWSEMVQENDLENAFSFAWSLRSILWPELIKSNNLEIRFTHDGSVGEGYGPYIFFGNTDEFKDLPTKSIQNSEKGLILESLFFSHSDMFMADYFDGLGFLGIQSLQIKFLSYENIDVDDEEESEEVLFENTFSADFRVTDDKMNDVRWADFEEPKQLQILNCLIDFSVTQLQEHGEFVQEVTDLFAAILVHKSTHLKVIQTLKSKLNVLKLDDLNSLIRP